MTTHTSQIQETFYDELVSDPDARFKKFFDFYCTVNLLPTFTIERYLRSSKELIRMANVYFGENDYLHAFVLYSRFIVLFLEKIKTHPEYSSCDKSQLNPILKQVSTLALPRAEKLKKYIKELFSADAQKYLKLQECKDLNERLAGTKLDQVDGTSSKRMNSEMTEEEAKKKINAANEEELRILREKELSSLGEQHNLPAKVSAGGAPLVDRRLKPQTSDGKNNHNLRSVYMPDDLISKFLAAALANTNKNIETCGFLAGKLSKNAFVIDSVIIPKQSGTSDTCNTTHEHELFDTIDSLNLITLGWIHTHPSQTAFLSSIDLHTQFGFQIMVPEAVAIVCAPKYNETRSFILTPNYGVKVISECSQGGFHMHQNNPPIFEECDHLKVDPELRVNLVDLRLK